MIRKVGGRFIVFSEGGKKLSRPYATRGEAEERLRQVEYFKHRGYSRKVDKKMRDYGETDYSRGLIRINPRKGETINTIIHEELHRKYPDKGERWVKKRAKREETRTGIRGAIRLLERYDRKSINERVKQSRTKKK